MSSGTTRGDLGTWPNRRELKLVRVPAVWESGVAYQEAGLSDNCSMMPSYCTVSVLVITIDNHSVS
jgi:hypothetical protein